MEAGSGIRENRVSERLRCCSCRTVGLGGRWLRLTGLSQGLPWNLNTVGRGGGTFPGFPPRPQAGKLCSRHTLGAEGGKRPHGCPSP